MKINPTRPQNQWENMRDKEDRGRQDMYEDEKEERK